MEPSRPPAVRLIVTDDLRRYRLIVALRLIVMIPHFIWLGLWSAVILFASVIGWVAVVILGRLPLGLHRFSAAYVRYTTHFLAFLNMGADPYPGFSGKPGYPVDVEIDDPVRQGRLGAFFRLLLGIPAMLIMGVAAGYPGVTAPLTWSASGGLAAFGLFFGWFAALALGRMPRGLRDLVSWGIGYSAQANAYLLLLTDRYPDSRPDLVAPLPELPEHPVRLELTDELRRNRLTVFFRLQLALPHMVWWSLWTTIVVVLTPFAWLMTLLLGRLPVPFHRFLAAWVRYGSHVTAFTCLIGGLFPGFVGASQSYPVGIEVAPAGRQRRLVTLFRPILVIPAWLIAATLVSTVMFLTLFLGWPYALVTRRIPHGLRDLGATSIRYVAQMLAYSLFLTERYPYSCPVVEGWKAPEPLPAWVPMLPGARDPMFVHPPTAVSPT